MTAANVAEGEGAMNNKAWLHAASVLLAGCATTSIQRDVTRVERLADVSGLHEVARQTYEASPETPAEVLRMLKTPLDMEGAVRVYYGSALTES